MATPVTMAGGVPLTIDIGGGYGDPGSRDAAAFRGNLANGYITARAAQRDDGYDPARR